MLFQIEKLPVTTTKHSRKRKVQSWKQLPFIFQSVLRLFPIILFIKFYIKLPYLLDEISKNVLLHTPISKISEYSYMYIIYNYIYYAIVLHNYETHKNRNFKKKQKWNKHFFNLFINSRCLLSTCHVPSSLGTKRNTQPQPCPPWAYSPASQQAGQLTLLEAHPPVFTVTLSMTPAASTQPATTVSAQVIKGFYSIAQLNDPPISSILLSLVEISIK